MITKPVYAMIEPSALPGAFGYKGESIGLISEKMLEEARILIDGGVDSLILQNINDCPIKQKARMECSSYMTRLALDLKSEFSTHKLGILVCWDGVASMIVASASGADYIRVEHVFFGTEQTDEGIIKGDHEETVEMKKQLLSSVPIYADVYEPHAMQVCPMDIEDAAVRVVEYGAETLFVSGKTLDETLLRGKKVKNKLPSVPLLCGGGSNPDNLAQILNIYDGVCVGSFIKDGNLSNPVNKTKLSLYMDEIKRVRDKSRAN